MLVLHFAILTRHFLLYLHMFIMYRRKNVVMSCYQWGRKEEVCVVRRWASEREREREWRDEAFLTWGAFHQCTPNGRTSWINTYILIKHTRGTTQMSYLIKQRTHGSMKNSLSMSKHAHKHMLCIATDLSRPIEASNKYWRKSFWFI